jgi:hypothetical protein
MPPIFAAISANCIATCSSPFRNAQSMDRRIRTIENPHGSNENTTVSQRRTGPVLRGWANINRTAGLRGNQGISH